MHLSVRLWFPLAYSMFWFSCSRPWRSFFGPTFDIRKFWQNLGQKGHVMHFKKQAKKYASGNCRPAFMRKCGLLPAYLCSSGKHVVRSTNRSWYAYSIGDMYLFRSTAHQGLQSGMWPEYDFHYYYMNYLSIRSQSQIHQIDDTTWPNFKKYNSSKVITKTDAI